jgi:Fe-S cluster biogenesis protein NfuA
MQEILDQKIVNVVHQQIARIADIVKAHGGGVSIVKASQEELILKLSGHCAGCVLAPMTYGIVLNKYIKEALPNLKEIKYTY